MFAWMGINTSLLLSNFIRQKMWHLNQISQTSSFEVTKSSIWFGGCKMQRLNWALLETFNDRVAMEMKIFGTK